MPPKHPVEESTEQREAKRIAKVMLFLKRYPSVAVVIAYLTMHDVGGLALKKAVEPFKGAVTGDDSGCHCATTLEPQVKELRVDVERLTGSVNNLQGAVQAMLDMRREPGPSPSADTATNRIELVPGVWGTLTPNGIIEDP